MKVEMRMHPIFAILLSVIGFALFIVGLVNLFSDPVVQYVDKQGKEMHVTFDKGKQKTFYLISGDGSDSWNWADENGKEINYDLFRVAQRWNDEHVRREKVLAIISED